MHNNEDKGTPLNVFERSHTNFEQKPSYKICFLSLSNLFNSLKIRHIVHTQHCKYVHIKYVQTLMLMTLMLTMHNGTSMIKNVQNLYIYLSQKLAKWHYVMYISIQRTICPEIN